MFIYSPKELASCIIRQRKKLKLSQTAVGELVGLKQKTISEFETKPESTQINTLFRILSALNLDIQLSRKDEIIAKIKWKEEW